MRKLAPMIIISSFALASGSALAGDMKDKHAQADKQGQPTVPANTTEAANKKLSYSDKSNTSPGTNAKMKKEHMAAADTSSQSDASQADLAEQSTTSRVEGAHDEDNKDIDRKNDLALSEPAANGNGDAMADKSAKKKAKKDKRDKLATTDASGQPLAGDVSNPDAASNPPLSATKAEEAGSTTGKSAGR